MIGLFKPFLSDKTLPQVIYDLHKPEWQKMD